MVGNGVTPSFFDREGGAETASLVCKALVLRTIWVGEGVAEIVCKVVHLGPEEPSYNTCLV